MTIRNLKHARRVLRHLGDLLDDRDPDEPRCGVCQEATNEFDMLDTEEHGQCCATCTAVCSCGARWPLVTMTLGLCADCLDDERREEAAADAADDGGIYRGDCRERE